jgi:hypothetical protein
MRSLTSFEERFAGTLSVCQYLEHDALLKNAEAENYATLAWSR